MTNSALLERRPVKAKVGVLALQGGFHEHAELLLAAGKNIPNDLLDLSVQFVRTPQDLESCDALILPGGESTTITLLANKGGLMQPLRNFVASKPVWGTCAGMICLANSIYNEDGGVKQKELHSIGGVDISVVRNQYGRQVSFLHPSVYQTLQLKELTCT
jgi:5'-phosphate synthase pdxT subunit